MLIKDLCFDPRKMLLSFRKSLSKLTDNLSNNLFELGLAIGSGMLMGITLAPTEAWYFAWIALAPLWYLVCSNSRSTSPQHRYFPPVIYGLCWGIGFYGLGLSWIFGIHPMTWMGVPFLGMGAMLLGSRMAGKSSIPRKNENACKCQIRAKYLATGPMIMFDFVFFLVRSRRQTPRDIFLSTFRVRLDLCSARTWYHRRVPTICAAE